MLNAVRDVQIPFLAALLIVSSAAKARWICSARSAHPRVNPTAGFPLGAHHLVALALCGAETLLGVALLVTAGSFGAGTPAGTIRGATALLFLILAGALHELRSRRPEASCGCFGDLSQAPVSWRTLARAVLLAVAAIATIGAPPLRTPASHGQVWLLLATGVAELAVLAALSPEIGELMVRLGYSEPCEVRRVPVSRTLAALRSSSQWRKYRRTLAAAEPSDVWRESCWRYVVFPGTSDGRPVDVVFAVYLRQRRPPVRAAVVDAATEERLASAGAVIPAQRTAPDLPALQVSNALYGKSNNKE